MRKTPVWILLVLIFCSPLLTGGKIFNSIRNAFRFGDDVVFNYGVSALQWLPEIQQKAKTWRADAYLFAISESEIDANGNSSKWSYLFYSPASGKSMLYTYNSGFIAQHETVLSPLNPVYSLRIDTPTALFRANEAAATKKFLENNAVQARVISLVGPDYDTRQVVSKWKVVYHGTNGTHRIAVDATSGAVIL